MNYDDPNRAPAAPIDPERFPSTIPGVEFAVSDETGKPVDMNMLKQFLRTVYKDDPRAKGLLRALDGPVPDDDNPNMAPPNPFRR